MTRRKTASAFTTCRDSTGTLDPRRPALTERPLLTLVDAVKVMALFKVLANDTRLRMLHYLVRNKEACGTEIAAARGMKAQTVSNQLQRLSDTRVLASRRDRNHVFYRVVNPCVTPLLKLALGVMADKPKNGGCDVDVN